MTFEDKLEKDEICNDDYEDFRTDKESKGIIVPCYFCNNVYFRVDEWQDEKFVNCDDCHNRAIRFHCL